MSSYNIKVIPNARKNSVTEEAGRLKVHVNAPAVDGKANEAVIEILAKHFGVRKSAVKILKGQLSREKTVEVSH